MNDNQPPIPGFIAKAAADWIVRRDGGALSPDEDNRFRAWLAEPAHRDSFQRLESLWNVLDAEPVTRSTRRRWRWAGAAIAAALALAVLGATQDWPTRLRADYATGVGERRTVALTDGSRITLDGASAIAVDVSGPRRRVHLLAGSALFQVAPDPSRPFAVEAAGGSATALGTAFAVRIHDGLADLVVTQHRVAVAGNGRSEIVNEGQRANFGADTLSKIEQTPDGATAWTDGKLVAVNRPLGEVVAEIARHRRGFLTVTGAAADQRVSGVYDLDHPVAAINSIERSLNLASFRLSDRIIILHR